MFYIFMYLLNLISGSIFLFMKHPMAMGLMLLIQTVMICLMSGTMMKTFWFSYILFLIFLGGMLVLFIYVTSLASNELFNFSKKIFILLSFSMITTLLITMLILDKNLMINYSMNFETESITFMKSFLKENSMMLNKLYNFPINMISILLMVYLFLALIASVKITNIFEGPLRPKN